MFCTVNNRLVLQWHITAKCNQRCKHCYQECYTGSELSIGQIEAIIEQYKELLVIYSQNKNSEYIKGHINVTGGEPFIRKDFMDIIKLFYKNKDYFSYGILTNGSLITEPIAKELKTLNVAHIQVSIDGKRETHDEIRGKGNFDQTWRAVKILKKQGIRTLISFTAHKGNYKEFPIVAKYARLNKASKLWSDRLVPMGSGEEMIGQLLSPQETMEYFEIMKKEKDKKFFNKMSGTEIYTNRALQFLKSGDNPYGCSAGNSLITILENGEILPCRRMPIECGNALESSLSDIYFNNPIFKDLRNENIPDKCNSCVYSKKCRGGLKCVSHALYNDYTQPEPSCPILK